MSSSSEVPIEGLAAAVVTPAERAMLMDEMSKALASFPENDTKDRPTTPADTQIKGEESPLAVETEADTQNDETDIGPAIYPPVLEEMDVLGYITDRNGIGYSRDIGRSALLHGAVFFIFGDTFSKDSSGTSADITSNTIAYVEDRASPLESRYLEISGKGKVKAFVRLNEEEIRFEEENEGARIVFRMFGGTIDTGLVGAVWYQKLIKYENGKDDYCGVGLAWLTSYSDYRIIVQRLPGLLFGTNEPRIGSFSTLCHGGKVYLWGDGPDGQIILARVNKNDTASHDRYEYWSGVEWVPHWHDAVPVLHDVLHGAIVKTTLFGKDKPFVFVGVHKQADSMVQIGAAAEVQGPFDLTALCKATGIDHDEEEKCCIYPHLWASNIPKRQLIVTWSEGPAGGVIAAKMKFKIDEVAAAQEAEERQREAEEREARRLARIAEEEAARDDGGYQHDSDESDDPRPKRDRSEGRLKTGHFLVVEKRT